MAGTTYWQTSHEHDTDKTVERERGEGGTASILKKTLLNSRPLQHSLVQEHPGTCTYLQSKCHCHHKCTMLLKKSCWCQITLSGDCEEFYILVTGQFLIYRKKRFTGCSYKDLAHKKPRSLQQSYLAISYKHINILTT